MRLAGDMGKTILRKIDGVAELAKRLSECPEVSRYDSAEYREAWAVADGFADLEGAFRTFLDECLPKLVDSRVRGEALVDVLQDVGEELRTILWHIQAPKFYQYLHNCSDASNADNEGKPKPPPDDSKL